MRVLDANCVFGKWPKQNLDVSAETLVKTLKSLNVEKGLAVSLRGVFYDPDAGNAETLEVCEQHSGLAPVATLSPMRYFGKADHPAKLREQGFRMLRLFPGMQGWSVDNILAERILGDCAAADMPVAVDVSKMAGVATDLVRHTPDGCRLILSGVYYHTLAESAEALRRRPEFVMEVGRTCMPESLEMLCEQVGAHRLVLGTAQPLDLGLGPIEMVQHANIPEENKQAILAGNLDALLGGI